MNLRQLTLATTAILALSACGSSDSGTQASETAGTPSTGTTQTTSGSSSTTTPSPSADSASPGQDDEFVDGTIKSIRPAPRGSGSCEGGTGQSDAGQPCAEATNVGTVLVSIPGDGPGSQHDMLFTVTAGTEVTTATSASGQKTAFDQLKVGTSVRVTIDGPVMTSDPEQATAGSIEVFIR